MKALTWLHLSDLHACHPRFAWDADRVTETLVRDLVHLQSERGLRPDLLFFTGDAAFGEFGSKPGETLRDQFAHFATFLERVRTAFEPEIELGNVFLVPGNHDVNRSWVSDDQTSWLDLMLEKGGSVDPVRAMMEKGGLQWRRYMERLGDYRSFLASHGLDHLLGDRERLIYATTREVHGVRIGIAGFKESFGPRREAERGAARGGDVGSHPRTLPPAPASRAPRPADRRIETRVRLPIQLDEVYIPLRARAVRSTWDHEYGALREVGAGSESHRDVAFDESLRLAAEHGLRGAVVLGDPGSGKTTLLKHFVLASTDPAVGPATLGLPRETIPVLVELRRLRDPTAGLKVAVEEAVAGADLSLDAARFTRRLLRQDRLLVLVDGLDEVAGADDRAAVSRWLEEALHQLPESTFLVSSRYAGYKGDARLSGRFLELHVRDVEPRAARRFIRAWYGAVEAQAELGRDPEVASALADEAANDLSEKIFQPEDPRTSSLGQLATNPLMLQILCLVHRDRKQLPERRVELYRECVQVLLELWRRAKGMPVDLDAPQALRLLRPLAFRLHAAEKREAPLAELLPHLAEPLRELRRPPEEGAVLLDTIRDQSGVPVALGQARYGFLHLSFQEYLCARVTAALPRSARCRTGRRRRALSSAADAQGASRLGDGASVRGRGRPGVGRKIRAPGSGSPGAGNGRRALGRRRGARG